MLKKSQFTSYHKCLITTKGRKRLLLCVNNNKQERIIFCSVNLHIIHPFISGRKPLGISVTGILRAGCPSCHQPTVSKHCREITVVTPTTQNHPPVDSWKKRHHCSANAGSPTPIIYHTEYKLLSYSHISGQRILTRGRIAWGFFIGKM